MDRHVARALEANKIAEAMSLWLDQLVPNQRAYDDTFDQHSGFGIGLSEAPRGALGHWVEITEGRISNYQVITPTCWNASPRDDRSVPRADGAGAHRYPDRRPRSAHRGVACHPLLRSLLIMCGTHHSAR